MGNIVATYKYDVFGAVRSSTGSASTDFRFTGQQNDAALGYTYLRARYYDPATGRFVSKDPFPGVLTNPASFSYYVYAQNNPANWTDPSGKFLPVLGAMAVGALIGGATGFAGSVAGQVVSNWTQGKTGWGLVDVDYSQAAVAGAAGVAAGALAPVVATSALGAAVLGATANAAGYVAMTRMRNESVNGWKLGLSAGIGGITGGVLGRVPAEVDGIPLDPNSPWLPAGSAAWERAPFQIDDMLSAIGWTKAFGGATITGVESAPLANWLECEAGMQTQTR